MEWSLPALSNRIPGTSAIIYISLLKRSRPPNAADFWNQYIKKYKNKLLATPHCGFSGPMKQTMINKYSNKHNEVKNPNWREADQLAIYKRSREVGLGATENNIS